MSKRGRRWTPEELERIQSNRGNAPVRATNRKPVRPNDKAGEVQDKADIARFDRINVRIHVTRKRRVDRDATRPKPVIDGIVRGGIVKDDSEDEISTIRITHETGAEESTVITVVPTVSATGAVYYG